MSHESGGVFDRPGSDAEGALESAARHLRASPRPAGATSSRQREILRGRQTRDLVSWAIENSRLVAARSYAHLIEDGGQEHRVWLDADRQRYFKATYSGRFGFSVVSLQDGSPELVAAPPLEYLERLLLHSSLFGDDILLHGVSTDEDEPVILTSQKSVVGGEVSRAEILEFMRRLWFAPLFGLSLGNPGSLSFYRDIDEIAAFDVHAGNLVKDTHGVVLPIDIILVRAEPELQKALEPFLRIH
jgi:hypothetical protein